MIPTESKVWLLLQTPGYERFPYGVYATKDDALAARAAWEESHSYTESWELLELEVGAPAQFYGWNDYDGNRDDEEEG